MATVYLAYDPRMKRPVALKVLPRAFLHDPLFLTRFEREAQTIASLEHPAIVPVHDYGEQDGQPYIVMRYMPGGTLADRIRKGKLSFDDTTKILRTLASALDKAHSQGIIHRDMKPANVLFDDDGNPYISDFGIVKLSQATAVTGSLVVGTPAYMSPEQAKGEQKLDGRSDVYSLGVIVYEMLSGEMPFEADSPIGLALKHVSEPVPNIRAITPDLPVGVEVVIRKAMAKEPDERFSTAQELASGLTTAKTAPVSEVPSPPPVVEKPTVDWPAADKPPAPQPARDIPVQPPVQPVRMVDEHPKRKLPPALIVAGVAAIGLLGVTIILGLGYLLFNGGSSPEPLASATLPMPTTAVAVIVPSSTPVPPIEQSSTPPPVVPPSETSESIIVAPATATPEFYFPLANCSPSRLHVGDSAYVSLGGSHNSIRSEPDTHPSDNIIATAEPGAVLSIISGPECDFGYLLWEVRTMHGEVGWTAETDGNEIWLVPITSWWPCSDAPSSRLHLGDEAVVTYDPPVANKVRLQPGTRAAERGTILPGEHIRITDGPICRDGFVWWEISSLDNPISGWTAEGDYGEFWLVPVPHE